MSPPLVITGPTGAGKTALALRLAIRHGLPIVSMDAMQVYRGLDIGTAKPTAEEQASVPHYGIDVCDPHEPFSAADFTALADRIPDPKLLVGGTVFYLRAWWQGLVPTPPADRALRAELEALPDPHRLLQEVDPVLAARLHPNDRVRIVRGLEVYRLSGQRLSALHEADQQVRREAVVVWVDRGDLYEALDRRVEAMMAAGYLEEVAGLLARGVDPTLKPMQSLGYRYLVMHLQGLLPLEEAVRLTQRDTRHFARKQRSFLRGMGLVPMDAAEAEAHLSAALLGK